jgi:protein-tyrosine-phosphatase
MKRVLFVCVENAGRSQMAEGFFRKYAPKTYQPISAGTKPSERINPLVVQAMEEVRIGIDGQKPKVLTEDMLEDSIVVNMGCMDRGSCPMLFMKNMIEWEIEDPKGKPIEKVREIRDEIERRVRELVSTLQ